MKQNQIQINNKENNPKENLGVHGLIYPVDVRFGEPIECHLIFNVGREKHNVAARVWRLSPVGIELICSELALAKGCSVDLKLRLGDRETDFYGLIVDEIFEDSRGQRLIFIRFLIDSSTERADVEKRKSERWLCSEQFYPTLVAPNPCVYNDFLFFRVKDISNGGFRLATSLRNKILIPGITLDGIVNFPMVSQTRIKIKVINSRVELENGKDILIIGVKYEDDSKTLNEIIGQYLFQFGAANSLKELEDSGFHVGHALPGVSFSCVKTKEEYKEVLDLRFRSYKASGKVEEGKTPLDMGDEYDSRSRIIIGRHKNKIVCSARLIFNQYDDKMEQEKFVEMPSDFPRRDNVVEVMRACVDPEYRGSDLLLGLFGFMSVIVAQSKRKYVVICATDNMVGFYKKLGFEELGISYPHKDLNNKIHHILYCNFHKGLAGYNVNPIIWNIVWANSLKYVDRLNLLQVDPTSRIRIFIYGFFAPLADLILKIKGIRKINNTWKQIK